MAAALTQRMDPWEGSVHPPHPPSKGRGRAAVCQMDKLDNLLSQLYISMIFKNDNIFTLESPLVTAKGVGFSLANKSFLR